MRKALGKRVFIFIICLLALGSLFIHPPIVWSEPLTHTVEKGDTLWSICEKYYGDSYLWPKLWQMNPFVTNPHFLKPGDVITLIEKELIEKTAPQVQEPASPPKKPAVPAPPMKGIDVSGFTNIQTIGFLSPGRKFEPLGRIVSTDSPRIILSKGDRVSVIIKTSKNIKPGDEFDIAQASGMLQHPITEKPLGHLLSIHGRLAIEAALSNSVFEAKIIEAFRSVNIGDLLIPHNPVSPCIDLIPANKTLTGSITASKDQTQLLGQFSIVYLDLGLNQGVRRGNMFEVIKERSFPDPDFKGETLEGRGKKIPLPDKRIGGVLILESRLETSTGLVISTIENFYIGATVKGFSWAEMTKDLSKIPSCTLE